MPNVEAIQPRESRAAETEAYLRDEPEGIFVVLWKKPPTIETLNVALAPMLRRFERSAAATQAFMIVSLARDPVAPEANRHAAAIARKWAGQCKPIAVIEESPRHRGFANRIALRMVLATAGALGLAPTVGFFDSTAEGVGWVAKRLSALGRPVRHDALLSRVKEMVARCSTQLS
jgi:hypothetical protein